MSGKPPSPTATIVSLATSHPSCRMSRADWLEIAHAISPRDVDRALLARLAERSAIDTRWCAAFDDGRCGFYKPNEIPSTAARMALWLRAAREMSHAAATRALDDAHSVGITPSDITHVVTASCTGFAAPSIDTFLIDQLRLARTVARLHVGFMGCHAAVNALAAARAAVLADPHAVVLVTMAEVSSAHFHHSTRLDQLIANSLFADGCAAMIVVGDERIKTIDPQRAQSLTTIAGTHAILIPETTAEMAWSIGNHGFEMSLGARVPTILEHEIRVWVERVLATHGLTRADVHGWAIHPGGPRVIDAVASALQLSETTVAHSRAILRHYGNMSSATLPFILERLAHEGIAKPWVGLAFGPGLAGEMIVCGTRDIVA
jgi:predicted naringenin-chalcone synthase